jgi:hypothetical protein
MIEAASTKRYPQARVVFTGGGGSLVGESREVPALESFSSSSASIRTASLWRTSRATRRRMRSAPLRSCALDPSSGGQTQPCPTQVFKERAHGLDVLLQPDAVEMFESLPPWRPGDRGACREYKSGLK